MRSSSVSSTTTVLLLHFICFVVHHATSSFATPTSPKPFNVIIVGGSSGMGKATATEVVSKGTYKHVVYMLHVYHVSCVIHQL